LLSESAQILEKHLPPSLDYITDRRLRKLSGLRDPGYTRAKKELVDLGLAQIGRGRGGPIRRTGTKKQQILARLPRDGSFVSNNKIYEPLSMTPEEFAAIQAEMIDEGMVVIGRGRYGRTARVQEGNDNGILYDSDAELGVADESELYDPVKAYFDRKWKRNYEPSPPNLYISEITAKQYPRIGITSIPDLSILTIMNYDFVPGNILELITIEVKKYGDLTLSAVYEAASMMVVCHRSYLVFEWVQDEDFLRSDSNAEYILTEAKRFGIGLVQMRPIDDGSWEFKTVLEPKLNNPEYGELNSFIEVRFKNEHARIRGALG